MLEPSFEEYYNDDVRVSVTPSIDLIDAIYTESPTLVPISSSYLTATTPPLPAFPESVGDIRGSNPSLDPSCAYLEDVPRKILLCTFVDHTFDFSLAYDMSMRTLPTFAYFLYLFSYSHRFEMHAQAHDKLLRALTAPS